MQEFDWKEKYKDKIGSAVAAMNLIKSGDSVFIGTGCAQPQHLVNALVEPAGGGSDQTGLRPAGRELKKHTIEETLTADPQLAIGVLIVKTKLIQTSALAEGRRD